MDFKNSKIDTITVAFVILFLSVGLVEGHPSGNLHEHEADIKRLSKTEEGRAELKLMWLGVTFEALGRIDEITALGNGDYVEGIRLLSENLQGDEPEIVPSLIEQMRERESKDLSLVFSIFKAYSISNSEITDYLNLHLDLPEDHPNKVALLDGDTAMYLWSTAEAPGHIKLLELLDSRGVKSANAALNTLRDPSWKRDEGWFDRYFPQNKKRPIESDDGLRFSSAVDQVPEDRNLPGSGGGDEQSDPKNRIIPYWAYFFFGTPVLGIGIILGRQWLRGRREKSWDK